jgi:hypothetical protein
MMQSSIELNIPYSFSTTPLKMLAIRKWVSTFPATPSQANETRYLFPNLALQLPYFP